MTLTQIKKKFAVMNKNKYRVFWRNPRPSPSEDHSVLVDWLGNPLKTEFAVMPGLSEQEIINDAFRAITRDKRHTLGGGQTIARLEKIIDSLKYKEDV